MPTPSAVSTSRPLASDVAAVQGKERLWRLVAEDARGDVLAERRSVLEPVAAAAADEPHVVGRGMAVDDEMRVGEFSYWQTPRRSTALRACRGSGTPCSRARPSVPRASGRRWPFVGSNSGPSVSSAILKPRPRRRGCRTRSCTSRRSGCPAQCAVHRTGRPACRPCIQCTAAD